MKLTFENVKQLEPGVWLAEIEPQELKGMVSKAAKLGEVSLAALQNPDFDGARNVLQVSVSGFSLLMIGHGVKTILVDQTPGSLQPVGRQGGVFSDFLDTCQHENMPSELISFITRLLEDVSRVITFNLTEGEARKWTAEPNFVAITIQNRNKQFLISVKGDHRDMNYQKISPARGRGISYSEFHFNSGDQYSEALDAILKSASA